MPTSIENFFNYASQHQFARDFLFRVKQISVPGLSLGGDAELIYARSASFPGRDIENKQVRYAGQTFNLNGSASYPGSEGWQLEFYADQGMNIRSKLETASRILWDNETTTGTLCMPGVGDVIILDVLQIPCQRGVGVSSGGSLEVGKTIELVGAGIRNIGEIGYQIAEGTGDVLTFTTTFSFHFYRNFTS